LDSSICTGLFWLAPQAKKRHASPS
jgi:hypothetical protein